MRMSAVLRPIALDPDPRRGVKISHLFFVRGWLCWENDCIVYKKNRKTAFLRFIPVIPLHYWM